MTITIDDIITLKLEFDRKNTPMSDRKMWVNDKDFETLLSWKDPNVIRMFDILIYRKSDDARSD